MRETQRINWTRTRLQPGEREDLMTALGSEQKAHLLKHDYVWVKGVGVLWKAPDGALRRARFTHGTHFRTPRGEFYIDSEGSVRELLESQIRASRVCSASAERSDGDMERYDDFGARGGPDNALPRVDAGCVEHRT